ncbi:MarR family winged helix-turn-helix transcriptional regulator [Elongatibacter sediminis]|uniref:MarR family winged helix-turn-helix transcriptional regulator n=1 Tax=Elongatibacter sediminis TaxID=3119006 RepID=A0AAW9RAK7_9GAMM
MTKKTSQKLPAYLDPAGSEFDLFKSPFYLIAHADFQYHADLDMAIAKYGLDRTCYRLLTILKSKAPLNIKDVAALTLLKRSTASRAIERMRQEGWVESAASETDQRLSNVQLSAEGTALAEKVMPMGRRQLERAIEGLEPSRIIELVRTLEHLVGNLSRLPIE